MENIDQNNTVENDSAVTPVVGDEASQAVPSSEEVVLPTSEERPDESSSATAAEPEAVEGVKESETPAPAVVEQPKLTKQQRKELARQAREAAKVDAASATTPVAKPTVNEKSTGRKHLMAEVSSKVGKDLASRWSDDALREFKASGKHPKLTKRGNHCVDMLRSIDLRSWSSEELLDWVEGDITLPASMAEDDVWAEVFRRWRLAGNLTEAAARALLVDSIKPQYTDAGLLVVDAQRENKAIQDYTYAELAAAWLGEIETSHDLSTIKAAMRKKLGINENYSEARLIESFKNDKVNMNNDDLFLRSKLDEYKKVMSRPANSLTEATAAVAQNILWGLIRGLLRREYREFHEGWNILLDFVNENYNTLFTPERARRGWSQLQIRGNVATTFEELLTLIIATRSAKTRVETSKIYKISQITRHMTNEAERQNLLTFYGQ